MDSLSQLLRRASNWFGEADSSPGPIPENDQSYDPANPTLHDIYHISFLLRQKVVPDLVPKILYHAGIFKTQSVSVERPRPLVIIQNTAPATVLTTEPIQSSARLVHPVRKVRFTITSSDQGWASDTDAGSWTWFTAAVVPQGVVLPDSSPRPVRQDELEGRFLAAGRETEIVRNVVAERTMQTHVVEWGLEDENAEVREWVASLEEGERVVVRAWARFPGWQNKVKDVKVEVCTAALVGDMDE